MILELKESEDEKKRSDDMLLAVQKLASCVCRLTDIQGEILEELKRHRLPAIKGIVQLGVPLEQ